MFSGNSSLIGNMRVLINNLSNADLIIDAGANVGYSSVYFLSNFPNCRVIAIEPDGDNFASLQKNLAPMASELRP